MTDQDERLAEGEYFDGHACITGDCPHDRFKDCFTDAYKTGYRAALESEEVRGLAELIYGLIDQCNSVAWNDISEAPVIIRNLEAALARFRGESK